MEEYIPGYLGSDWMILDLKEEYTFLLLVSAELPPSGMVGSATNWFSELLKAASEDWQLDYGVIT